MIRFNKLEACNESWKSTVLSVINQFISKTARHFGRTCFFQFKCRIIIQTRNYQKQAERLSLSSPRNSADFLLGLHFNFENGSDMLHRKSVLSQRDVALRLGDRTLHMCPSEHLKPNAIYLHRLRSHTSCKSYSAFVINWKSP
jgi:hypothetical protein